MLLAAAAADGMMMMMMMMNDDDDNDGGDDDENHDDDDDEVDNDHGDHDDHDNHDDADDDNDDVGSYLLAIYHLKHAHYRDTWSLVRTWQRNGHFQAPLSTSGGWCWITNTVASFRWKKKNPVTRWVSVPFE